VGLQIGIDIIDTDRVKLALSSEPNPLELALHASELLNLDNTLRISGIFAAKEALLKALSGQVELEPLDFEIVHDAIGSPKFLFHKSTFLQNVDICISISHTSELAVAVVVVNFDDKPIEDSHE
jgi:phosphopantetheine--protein transferase-like protein